MQGEDAQAATPSRSEREPSADGFEAIPPIEQSATAGGDYEPLSRSVARVVRESILNGQLASGTRIRQEALAKQLGTSRIPVREALLELEAEGLITMVPHSGARVAKLDLAEHTEIYRLREVIEPMAIAESAQALTDEQIEEIRRHELAVEKSAGSHDSHRWLTEDRAFHLATYAAAPMPRVRRMIEGFWNSTQQYRRAYLSTLDDERIEMVNWEHRLLVGALVRRDALEASTLLASHIRRTRITLSARPELFGRPRPTPGEINGER